MKILLLIGDAGGGHIACAKAVEQAFLKKDSGIDIKIVDLLQFSRFTKTGDYLYSLVSKYRVIEFFYNIGNILINRSKIISEIFLIFYFLPLYKPTLEFLKKEKPDLVICNNGLTVKVVGKCRENLGFKYIITVPDLISISRAWANSNADLTFSPTKEAEKTLKSYSSDLKIVTPYYPLKEIRVYSKREISVLKEKIFKEYSLLEKKPTILITGCGWGTRGIIKKLDSVINSSSYQFIIITGKDEKLRMDLERRFRKRRNIVVMGYTNLILDFFSISDLIIAKPGPATLLEIERLGKKAIFTSPVGYQEWGNVTYLKKNPNFIYIGKRFNSIEGAIRELLDTEDIEYVSEIKDANDIVEYILEN